MGWIFALVIPAFQDRSEEPPAVILEARLQAWRTSARGRVEGDTPSTTGTRLRIRSDLGLGRTDRDFAPELTLALSLASTDHRVWLAVGEIEFNADTVLPRDLTFEGANWAAGDPARTAILIQYAILGAELGWVSMDSPEDRVYAFLTLEGGVEGFAARTKLETASLRDHSTVYSLFDWAGVRMGWRLDVLSAHLFGRMGSNAEYGCEAALRIGHLAFAAGWRSAEFIGIDVEGDRIEHARIQAFGPYLGLELRY